MGAYDQLQIREIFHLEFLRRIGREAKGGCYALKGGVNLRLFFKSIRYSEDMDLDAFTISKSALSETVMKILGATSFHTSLKTFGIDRLILPDMAKAKQTDTTQRFKIHLITSSGEDLFTKIEFSRRGVKGGIRTEAVSDNVLRPYKMVPLITPHYDIAAAVSQKIKALAGRAVTQARDIFDLFYLSPQYETGKDGVLGASASDIRHACERVYEIEFEVFRDTVAAYLAKNDRKAYDNAAAWDEIKLKTLHFLEGLIKNG